MKKNRGNKGEITTQQIVLLIILLVSFAVILFLLFRLDFFGQSESEICHNSVVMRASPVSKDAVPLKCSRQYICLSNDNSCEKMTEPKIIKVKTKEEVYNAIAEEMADCWWMFGEGRINYIGNDMKENLYCSICDQILFDDSIGEIESLENGIDEKSFYTYLEDKPMSEEGDTYLTYITGATKVSQIESSLRNGGGTFGKFELNTQYFIMMGIYSKVGVLKWVGVGAAALGLIAVPFTGGLSAGITAMIIGVSSTAGGAGGYFVGTAVKGDGVENEFLKPIIVEANSKTFDSFDCKDIMTST
jgi:hypothetical protein